MTGDDLLGSSVQARPQQNGLGGQQCRSDDEQRPSRGDAVMVSRAVISATARTTSTVFMARKTSRPMPTPRGRVMPGARNFSGVSRNEMASTMSEPHERHGRADELSGCRHLVHAPVGLVDGAGRGTSAPA